MPKPLAIDLFCGLGGWAEGFLAEGWDVVGFDIEAHVYGNHRYPAQLVLQDVMTLHGSQFRNADCLVCSPPCQEYSYMAMPWKRAKAKAAAIRADETGRMLADLNRLFEACFRIQAQASLAAGRHIPMVVENVRGAQPWVGRCRWSFGSFCLWGDVPALMPITIKAPKVPGFRFDGNGGSFQTAAVMSEGFKSAGLDWSRPGTDFTRLAGEQAIKNSGGSWFNVAHNTASGVANNPARGVAVGEGTKCGGDWFGRGNYSPMWHGNSKGTARRFASAMIAKIPLMLSRHIAAVYRP